ncbi:zinc finger MYM-type protein 1-like [Sitophilus oryzae]|uniref:Zinc finger MYM-type protein 1-like n=1 Tax=Sitophilus oryzae TaxID=7048 RepID=A0A6J2XMG2_SITOR|nr:zinc finger MYM-type protein 1-like [Sitophilus oryzae]
MQRTALALNEIVLSTIEDLDCGLKLVGQSYDGAAVMAGQLGGLQAKVKETYPSALFVYCMAHRLNLVMQQSLNKIRQCKIFFQTLSGLAAFFSKSPKRSTALDQEVHKRLPRVAPTRWSYNGRLVETVFEYRLPLIDFFQKIMDNRQDLDNETVVCSTGYLNMLQRESDFNFLLLVFSQIFPLCDNLFSVLQSKMSDINFCIRKIQEFRRIVSSKWDQFDEFWQKFEYLDILSREPERKRTRAEDTVNDKKIDPKTQARKLFYEIIDNILAHIDDRFNNFKSLKFLELVNFEENNALSEEAFNSLQQNYPSVPNCLFYTKLQRV